MANTQDRMRDYARYARSAHNGGPAYGMPRPPHRRPDVPTSCMNSPRQEEDTSHRKEVIVTPAASRQNSGLAAAIFYMVLIAISIIVLYYAAVHILSEP